MKQLIQAKFIKLPDIKAEPVVKPHWWNDNAYYEYHRSKGHKTMSCFQLKHMIQDLLEQGVIEVDPPHATSNTDHTIFKTPLLDHDKGKASSSNSTQTANYANTGYNNVINCFRTSNEYVSTLRIKGQDPSCTVTTRQSKIVLKGVPVAPSKPIPTSQYNLLEHLGKTPAQISILELLKMSPMHRAVLDKALIESTVPIDIDVDQFQARIGHLVVSQNVAFSDNDISPDKLPHNDPLHLEVFVNNCKIRRVLIDGGVGLNICTLRVVIGLGYTENDIDASKRITIKAYDDAERPSKGIITLPIRLGPVIENTFLQVLDLDLPYNMILGRPWIHAMKAVPSTYHQCLKYPYNGTKITIPGDPNPFQFCATLKDTPQQQVPVNREAKSQSYVDPNELLDVVKGKLKI